MEERVYRVYLNKSDILKEKEPAEHIVEELERKNTVAAYGKPFGGINYFENCNESCWRLETAAVLGQINCYMK